jgi:hypothetical protein
VRRGRGTGGGGARAALGAAGRGAVADEIDDRRAERARPFQARVVVDEGDLAGGGAELNHARGVGLWEVGAAGGVGAAAAGRLLHEEVLAGREEKVGERRDLPRRAVGRGVLHRPAAERGRRVAAVKEFDEVVFEGRAGVTAAPVDLADDDLRGGRRRRCG